MIRVHISTTAEATALKFRELIVLMRTNVQVHTICFDRARVVPNFPVDGHI